MNFNKIVQVCLVEQEKQQPPSSQPKNQKNNTDNISEIVYKGYQTLFQKSGNEKNLGAPISFEHLSKLIEKLFDPSFVIKSPLDVKARLMLFGRYGLIKNPSRITAFETLIVDFLFLVRELQNPNSYNAYPFLYKLKKLSFADKIIRLVETLQSKYANSQYKPIHKALKLFLNPTKKEDEEAKEVISAAARTISGLNVKN